MPLTTLSSREFNQGASRAKKAAKSGPVAITDRGRPAQVLLSFEEYKRLTGEQTRIADLLSMPGVEDKELDLPKASDLATPADLA